MPTQLAQNVAFRFYRVLTKRLAPVLRSAYEHKHAQQWCALQQHQQQQGRAPVARWDWLWGWLGGAGLSDANGDPHVGERWGCAPLDQPRPHTQRCAAQGAGRHVTESMQDVAGDNAAELCVWFHAASIGEGLSVLPLIHLLLGEQEDEGMGGEEGAAGRAASATTQQGSAVAKRWRIARVVLSVGTVGGRHALRLAEEAASSRRHHHQHRRRRRSSSSSSSKNNSKRLSIVYAPIDLDEDVERFLHRWRPDAAVWAESELWPTMLAALRARDVPLALVNARLSQTSLERWRRWAPGLGTALGNCFSLVLCRSSADGARWAELRGLGERVPPRSGGGGGDSGDDGGGCGGGDVSEGSSCGAAAADALCVHGLACLGDLKVGSPSLPLPPQQRLAPMAAAVAGRPVWVVLSSHEDDERAALRAHVELVSGSGGGGDEPQLARLLTIIQPRHPERGAFVAAAAAAALAPLRCGDAAPAAVARRSRPTLAHPIGNANAATVAAADAAEAADSAAAAELAACSVYILDTLGESALAHALASVALVGGTMGETAGGERGEGIGGHNVLEPMRAGGRSGGGDTGCAVLHGLDASSNEELLTELAAVGAGAGSRESSGRAVWTVHADGSDGGGQGRAVPLSDALRLLLSDAEAQRASVAAAQHAAATVGDGVLERTEATLRAWLDEHVVKKTQ